MMKRSETTWSGVAVFAAITACAVSAEATAQAVASNADKFQLVIASAPGGGYDTYGRLVARHLGEELPGKPNVVSVNMPGASGITAVNHMYSVAPKDGSVIAALDPATPVYQVYGYPGTRYKSDELSWVGCLNQGVNVLAVMNTAGVKTLEDAKNTQVLIGALTLVGTAAAYPLLLNNTLGTKFKVVTGYAGANEIHLAMERGEVQGRGSNPWASWKSTKPEWVEKGTIVPLVQVGTKTHPELPNVPLLNNLATDDEMRQMFELVSAPMGIERPYAAPPGVPSVRLEILRRSFDRMTKNPAFIADAARLNMEIDPLPGEAVQKAVAGILATPPGIVEKVKFAISKE